MSGLNKYGQHDPDLDSSSSGDESLHTDEGSMDEMELMQRRLKHLEKEERRRSSADEADLDGVAQVMRAIGAPPSKSPATQGALTHENVHAMDEQDHHNLIDEMQRQMQALQRGTSQAVVKGIPIARQPSDSSGGGGGGGPPAGGPFSPHRGGGGGPSNIYSHGSMASHHRMAHSKQPMVSPRPHQVHPSGHGLMGSTASRPSTRQLSVGSGSSESDKIHDILELLDALRASDHGNPKRQELWDVIFSSVQKATGAGTAAAASSAGGSAASHQGSFGSAGSMQRLQGISEQLETQRLLAGNSANSGGIGESSDLLSALHSIAKMNATELREIRMSLDTQRERNDRLKMRLKRRDEKLKSMKKLADAVEKVVIAAGQESGDMGAPVAFGGASGVNSGGNESHGQIPSSLTSRETVDATRELISVHHSLRKRGGGGRTASSKHGATNSIMSDTSSIVDSEYGYTSSRRKKKSIWDYLSSSCGCNEQSNAYN